MQGRELDPRDASRCRICGRDARLAPVPPVAPGEDPARAFGLSDWLGRDQGGAGAVTLCPSCNEIALDWYLPEFRKWCRAGTRLIEADRRDLDRDPEPTWSTTQLKDVRPARFLKQLITMLLAIAPPGLATGEHAPLAAYAEAPGRRGLPARYHVYLALYRGPFARFVGYSAQLDPRAGRDHELLELAYPPFSCVLSLNGEAGVETTNIAEFAELDIDEVCIVDLDLLNGFGHTPFPADFRTRAAVERDREADRRAA
jgi:hypothetical protein